MVYSWFLLLLLLFFSYFFIGGLRAILTDQNKLVVAVGGVTALAAGIYTTRYGTDINLEGSPFVALILASECIKCILVFIKSVFNICIGLGACMLQFSRSYLSSAKP